MPNRYIREAAIESEAVNSLTWQAEVFWRRLLNRVDDFGRFTADAELLRIKIFPRQLARVRVTDMERLLAQCEKAVLLYRYEHEGKRYLVLDQWEGGRAKASHYPAPPPHITQRLRTSVYIRKHMSPTPTPTPTKERETREAELPEANVPSWDEIRTFADMDGIPEAIARAFFDHHHANNMWRNRHGVMINVRPSLMIWHNRNRQGNTNGNRSCRTNPQRIDRSLGTANEGIADQYKGVV